MPGKRSEGSGKHLVSTLLLPQKTRKDGPKKPINSIGKMVSIPENSQTHAHARTHPTFLDRLPRLPLTTTRQELTTPTDLTTWHGVWFNWNMARTGPRPDERDSMNTKSEKLNKIINQATRRGLKVEILENHSEWTESYSLRITMGITETNNMLELMRSGEMIHVHAIRSIADGKPRAFKLSASKYHGLGTDTKIQPTRVSGWVSMMADDLEDHNTRNQAA